MNWTPARDIIIPFCENFRDYGHHDKFSKSARLKIIAEGNYSCRYCGGIYPKYLMCVYLPSSKCNDVCCRICYIITHLNYGLFQEVELYYSTIPQLEIIRTTVDYIITNNDIPDPAIIDPSLQTPPISLLEYINILNTSDTIPLELENYKIFFGARMNLDFIEGNYGNRMIKFIDGVGSKVEKPQTVEQHIPTQDELKLFNRIFPCASPTKGST